MTRPAEAAERGFDTMGAVRGHLLLTNCLEDELATVFLPLSFLTGFFGQNLGWLVNRGGSLTAFLIFGIGTEALAVIILFVMFRRRGWLGRGS